MIEVVPTPVIRQVKAREILDSRGNPTVEAEVWLSDGTIARGAAPSGASTGVYEAVELRDEEPNRYMGKGVAHAVSNVNEIITHVLAGRIITHQREIDMAMVEKDHSSNKSVLGANAILAVSIACARAAAKSMNIPLYRYLGGVQSKLMPIPMMNILNGGAHVSDKNSQDFQEFMIVPVGAGCFKEALRMGTEVYHSLKKILNGKGYSTAVGDEGGFAPAIASVDEVLEILSEAVSQAGYEPGKDILCALDVAASEWKPDGKCHMIDADHKITGQFCYHLPKAGLDYTTDQLIQMYKDLTEKYPIFSIEDPLDEEDWEGWRRLTEELGKKVHLVGDDLFVTNTGRLAKGIEKGCGNSILIKLNQIGTISETLDAIQLAHSAGYTAIVSHRSGETEDTTIADLAVGLNCGYIKTGAPCRSERVAKYNQLLRIEELIEK